MRGSIPRATTVRTCARRRCPRSRAEQVAWERCAEGDGRTVGGRLVLKTRQKCPQSIWAQRWLDPIDPRPFTPPEIYSGYVLSAAI
eukprot:742683-Pleurochrysis_carterae.AAC.2